VRDRSAVCVNFGLLWPFCRLPSRFSPLRELCGAIIICCSKVDLAVLFGLLAFLLNFVPNVGAVLDAPLAAASMRRSMLPCITAESLRIASCVRARCNGDSPFASARRAAPRTVCVALFVCIGCCGHSVASCTMYVASDHASAAGLPQLPKPTIYWY
jgi:hypothetical protein